MNATTLRTLRRLAAARADPCRLRVQPPPHAPVPTRANHLTYLPQGVKQTAEQCVRTCAGRSRLLLRVGTPAKALVCEHNQYARSVCTFCSPARCPKRRITMWPSMGTQRADCCSSMGHVGYVCHFAAFLPTGLFCASRLPMRTGRADVHSYPCLPLRTHIFVVLQAPLDGKWSIIVSSCQVDI